MKKKLLPFVLTGIIAISAAVPAAVMGAETWNYGYNKTTQQDYSHYYHTSYYHSAGMTKNSIVYKTAAVSPGYWARLNLDMTGPYRVTYQKYLN